MKKTKLRIFALLLLLSVLLSACGPLVTEEDIPESFTIYASFYPVYALSALIITEDVPGMHLHQLVQPQDGCLRNYSLSDWDAYLLASADAVILAGNGLESFESAFASLEKGPAVISATSALVLETGEELAEEADFETADHFSGANPWLFLSVDGAMRMTEAICANMMALDPKYEGLYAENLVHALEKLELLQKETRDIVGAPIDTPVALAHEGLVYMAKEWNLNVCATLRRESGVMPDEDEFREMLALLQESGAKAVLIEKQAPAALVEALVREGYSIAKIDTLSTLSESHGTEGYFQKMTENAQEIRRALSNED